MPKVLGIPKINIGRSAFPREFRTLTTFNNGELVPILVEPNITPGDTVQIPIKALIRMQTPLYPVMDVMFADIAAFYVPDRLVWDHFTEFWGENNSTYWEQPTEYETPQIEAPQGGWNVGSLADYMGLPTGVDGISVSHLPFRAFAKIWNDYYRDENLKQPIYFNTDETTLTGKNNSNPDSDDYITDVQLGAFCPKVAKVADYFTKALPEPQKGPDVPLFSDLPVQTRKENATDIKQGQEKTYPDWYYEPLRWADAKSGNPFMDGYLYPNETGGYRNLVSLNFHDSTNVPFYKPEKNGASTYALGTETTVNAIDTRYFLLPQNLWAKVSDAAIGTINELRMAFAMQRYYEALARSGSRYIEILSGIFGVQSSDARLQRAEFLGGKRYRINMTQVLANTEGTNQHIGSTGGMSQTIINDYLCTHSFEEHGTLIVCLCTRTEHTYQQGIPKAWLRKKQFDYFTKALDHIGEQPVLNAEIYAQGTDDDNEVFGYQPAFEDMRLGRKVITGEMRSHSTVSLDAWHYGDDYNSLPILGNEWIDEPTENVDRTLTIQSSVSNQLFGDFVFNTIFTRGMSMYGTPGFMDHM